MTVIESGFQGQLRPKFGKIGNLFKKEILDKDIIWTKHRLSQSRSLGFLVWCGRTRLSLARASRSKARLVSKSRTKHRDSASL